MPSVVEIKDKIIELIRQQQEEYGQALLSVVGLELSKHFKRPFISVHPRKVRSPLVLPPKNFVSNGVTFSEFLREVRLDQSPKVPHDKYDALWQIRDREGVKGYRDRRRLDFKPAAVAAHGRAAIPASRADDVLFALGTFYRLGVPFHELLHFDIDRQNGAPINLPMWCEKIGAMTPKITGEHVNIYPNDRVGNDS